MSVEEVKFILRLHELEFCFVSLTSIKLYFLYDTKLFSNSTGKHSFERKVQLTFEKRLKPPTIDSSYMTKFKDIFFWFCDLLSSRRLFCKFFLQINCNLYALLTITNQTFEHKFIEYKFFIHFGQEFRQRKLCEDLAAVQCLSTK